MGYRRWFIGFNLLGYYASWVLLVSGATSSQPSLGYGVGFVFIGVHFFFSTSRKADFLLMCTLALLGTFIEYMMVYFKFFSVMGGPTLFAIPLWLVVVWAVFSLTLSHGLSWLVGRPIIQAILGAIFGPLTYWAGMNLGAITFQNSTTGLLGVGTTWMIALPLCFQLKRLIDSAVTRTY